MQSLWMLFATLAFSLMGVGVKLASELYSTGEIVFYRCLVSVLIMAAVLRRTGVGVRTPYAAMHIKRSVFGVTALMLWFTSISLLPLATAMTLNYMSPVWIALIVSAGAALAGTGGSDRKLIGAILLSFGGVICLLQPSVGPEQLTGGAVGLVSGFFTALAYVEVKALGQIGEPESRIVFYFSCIGLLVGAVWMAFTDVHAHTWKGAGLLLLIGILATIGQTAMTRAYKRGNTLLTANLQYAGIVFASLWGMLVWRDRLNWVSWIGMALIIASGIATTLTRARETSRDEHTSAKTPIKSPEAEVHPEL